MDELLRLTAPACIYQGVPVYYEDNHLLILEKPPNLPAQADSSGDADLLTVAKRYIADAYQKPGAVYLGLVHRLDRPVGGLMVLARTSKAAARLSAQVRAKTLRRLYLAVVRGDAPEEGTLQDFLYKDARQNTSRVVLPDTPGAKEALLSFRRLATWDGLSLLQVRLSTGRSHQIRVQLAHAGLPLWGDARYGGGVPGQQISLRGAGLGLEHPTRPLRIEAYSPPPWADVPWQAFADHAEAIPSAMEDWF